MDAKGVRVSGRRRMARITHTWPIVISVETEDVGVEGESIDGFWTVMAGRRT